VGSVATRHCAEMYDLNFQVILRNSQVFIGSFESINADFCTYFHTYNFTVGIRYFSPLI